MPELPEVPPSHFARVAQAALTVVAGLSFDVVLVFFATILRLEASLPAGFADAASVGCHVLTALLSAYSIWKRLPLRWVMSVIGCNCLFLLWLASDESAPPSPPPLEPILAADARPAQVYSWLVKGGPHSRLAESPAPQVALPPVPAASSEWAEAVRRNRAAWERAIAEDTLGRSWLEAMAESEPTGVYPNDGPATPLLDFSRVRRAVQCQWARAQFLQEDGQPDEAVAVLLTVLRASYNLQRAGPVLVTQMIALVGTKGSYERLDRLVASGAVSVGAKDRIRQLLSRAPQVEASLALAFAGEQVFARRALEQMAQDAAADDWGALGIPLSRMSFQRVLGPVFLNPNRTAREQMEFLTKAARAAQSRPDGPQPIAREARQRRQRLALKNPIGRRLVIDSAPAFDKVVAVFWANEDLRVALLKQVTN